MSYGINSILRFTGNNAERHIQELEVDNYQPVCPASPTSGDWHVIPINHNDVFVCYTNSTDNKYQHIPLQYVKEKFEELSQGKIYALGDPQIQHGGTISGTVMC